MSIRKEAETERQKLRSMPPKDRAWYIWEYYKFHILALILAAAALWTLGSMLYRQTFTTRLSIAIVNDQAGGASSTAGLEANLRQALGFGKKDLIEINEGLSARFGQEGMSQFEYASLAKISALVARRRWTTMGPSMHSRTWRRTFPLRFTAWQRIPYTARRMNRASLSPWPCPLREPPLPARPALS